MIIIKKIYIILLISGGILSINIGLFNIFSYHRNYKYSSYKGIIKEIKYREEEHGDFDVKVDNNWQRIVLHTKYLINDSLEIGDSIVKLKGRKEIYIYRKDSINNKWTEKIF